MRNVRDAFRVPYTEGDLGIEIEVEGINLPRGTKHWRREADGSLRGMDNGEYVLNSPCLHKDLDARFAELTAAFKKAEARIDDTYRAGVHVHVNVQDLSTTQLFNMIVLWLVLEEAFVGFCAPSRRGNHFCMRAKDAGYLTEVIWNACLKGDLRLLNTEDIRYSAMNLSSLFKYGSIEFRSLESTEDFNHIKKWANMLYMLREASKRFVDPAEIMSLVSMGGYHQFVVSIMGEYAPMVFAQEGWEAMIKRGIRQAQDIAFSRKWGKLSLDIFARGAEDF